MSTIYKNFIARVDQRVPAKLRPLWVHPAGPQTVFFWAPAFKWCLVIAGVGDMARPAEKLSLSQSTALAATDNIIQESLALSQISVIKDSNEVGRMQKQFISYLKLTFRTNLICRNKCIKGKKANVKKRIIWSRYSMVIIPKNWSLLSVNIFVALTGLYQLSRIYKYRQSLPKETASD